LNADNKISNIRLREGEYQYNLANIIASFQLELHFPNVKEIIERSFGEERTDDVQFVRKIQTILKKMEKSNIIRILPKKKPWDLQRYGLSSFKFQDVEKNLVTLATNQQIEESKNALHSILSQRGPFDVGLRSIVSVEIFALAFVIVVSYVVGVWALMQPVINPIVFISASIVAVLCSVALGKMLSKS
jgi:hypothetical protein